MKKYVVFCGATALLLAAAFAVIRMAPFQPVLVELLYSRTIYPAYNAPYAWFSGLFPFSLAEPFAAVCVLLLLLMTACCALLLFKKQFKAFFALLAAAAVFACSLAVSFYFDWGLSYYRLPIAIKLGLPPEGDKSRDGLEALCYKLADIAIPLRETLSEQENGVVKYSPTLELLKKTGPAYGELAGHIDIGGVKITRAKPLLISELMNRLGISGIYIPYSREPNINARDHVLLRGVTAAHEAAHLAGIAREDEANFIGFLACFYSRDPELMYSGVMLALIESGNALCAEDGAAYSRLREYYSYAMHLDLSSYSDFYYKYQSELRDKSEQVNDSYLKAHGQQSGVKSYGRMVDLLLDADAAGWLDNTEIMEALLK